MVEVDLRAQLHGIIDRLQIRAATIIGPALDDLPLPPAEAAEYAGDQLKEISHAVFMMGHLRKMAPGCDPGPGSTGAAPHPRGLLLGTYDMAYCDLKAVLPDSDKMLAGWFLLSLAHRWPIAGSAFDNAARAHALLRIAQVLWDALLDALAAVPQLSVDLALVEAR